MKKHRSLPQNLLLTLLMLCSTISFSQNLLNRTISITINNQRLDDILEIISNQENFYFSYNTRIINKDTLLSAEIKERTIADVLTTLLGNSFEFKESGNYIIIRKAPLKLRLVTTSAETDDKFYFVSGWVVDDQTGEKIAGASIYEKERLLISNTNRNGFFKLRLRSRYERVVLSVSKEFYEDTSVTVRPRYNQTLTITMVPLNLKEHTVIIGPDGYKAPDSIELEVPVNDSLSWMYKYVKKDSDLVEKTALAKFLVSSRQRLQTINLKNFFTVRPWQVSVIPGVSTNGKLNAQVINNFSFNLLGGYSGGTNGLEVGGLINIDKKDVGYVQVAGLSNLVGRNVTGVQVAGITNTVLGDFDGVQVGGITNYLHYGLKGVQIAGIYNHVGEHSEGAQIAGLVNFANRTTKGIQIAAIGNISTKETKGVQIGGLFNYTRKLKGVQIGLINVSDTSEGFSIGIFNIVFKGYHKLSIYSNELMDINAAFKTGNRRLYSILLVGSGSQADKKLFSYGYGLGTEISMGRHFATNLELSSQYVYRGSASDHNNLSKINLLFNLKITKGFGIYAGPSYSVFVTNEKNDFPGYKPIPPTGYSFNKLGSSVVGWIGWTAGVNIF